ncbi:MBL fold metallo-hydrolase [Hoeflea sp. TYP-13]|uniref:MBL fold metallo-hydrolase n=1 Tax=Hoeflea sp. TYP-13 TaxID=3230023 RepID=UPI0034C64DA2
MTKILLRLLAIAAAAAFAMTVAGAQDAKRGITNVAGDVYRFQNNFHFGLLVVTDEGVVLVDTINTDASQWLKDNLNTITDKPVTHLIYSHSHLDHASGGQVFADGIEVIAHANAPDAIDGVAPTKRFDDIHTLNIGGKTIELTWLGEGHGKDLIAVVVRPENVAFITDAASPKRLPFRDMPNSNIDGWIDQVRKIETLDFEIFAPAHGNVGVKADAIDARIYMEMLRAQVLTGLKAGKSVDELVSTIMLDDFSDWGQYDTWREPNIRGMARFLTESGQVN